MARKIIVVPHDPAWPILFRREADWLSSLLPDDIVAIHHFGSTAIPYIYAKPIIDILIEARDIERVDAANERMLGLGFLPKGEFGISGRRFFIKGDEENRTHHIHFYAAGHEEVARHLDFRDYMIAHPLAAEAYSRLKIELARRFPEDINGYNAGKDVFVKEIDRKAKVWKENGRAGKSAKDEFLDVIRISARDFTERLSALSESEALRPGAAGEWSVKDILAHINYWQRTLLDQVQAVLRGEPLPPPAGDTDAANAQAVASSRSRPWALLLQDFQALVGEMMETVAEIPQEDLFRVGRFKPVDAEPLWRSIASETYEHYQEHRGQVRPGHG